ncbi:hypothetical protein NP233_g7900 [Leucocoprinus birnbaumii]|nr:hypothetical protein NP233_g7900 [Leucocoprinus birnbaumii]
MYFNGPTRDGKVLRSIVHILLLLDTIQTLITMSDIFFWFVYNFGDYSALLKFNLASIDGPFLDAIITVIVQLVYCWRLKVIGDWKVVPAISALLSVVSCAGGLTVGIHDIVTPREIKPAVYLWLFSTATTDIVIACSMAYLIVQYRRQSMASRTTFAIVKRIVLLTLETNAVTATAAIALVTVFLIPSISPPKTNIYLALYSNCFMVLLNQRIYYEARGKNNREISTNNSGIYSSGGDRSQTRDLDHLSNNGHTAAHFAVIKLNETRLDDPQEVETDGHKTVIV